MIDSLLIIWIVFFIYSILTTDLLYDLDRGLLRVGYALMFAAMLSLGTIVYYFSR